MNTKLILLFTITFLFQLNSASAETRIRLNDEERLMDWAENTYPQFFSPAPSVTKTDFPGWKYRFYKDTGTAVGIQNGKDVFVSGGSFSKLGTLIYIDKLTTLLTSVELSHLSIQMETFDKGSAGTVPKHWEAGITGEGKPVWKLEKDNTAPSNPLVLVQSGVGGFPWCIQKESQLTDGFVSVKFKATYGQIDQAAGLV